MIKSKLKENRLLNNKFLVVLNIIFILGFFARTLIVLFVKYADFFVGGSSSPEAILEIQSNFTMIANNVYATSVLISFALYFAYLCFKLFKRDVYRFSELFTYLLSVFVVAQVAALLFSIINLSELSSNIFLAVFYVFALSFFSIHHLIFGALRKIKWLGWR